MPPPCRRCPPAAMAPQPTPPARTRTHTHTHTHSLSLALAAARRRKAILPPEFYSHASATVLRLCGCGFIQILLGSSSLQQRAITVHMYSVWSTPTVLLHTNTAPCVCTRQARPRCQTPSRREGRLVARSQPDPQNKSVRRNNSECPVGRLFPIQSLYKSLYSVRSSTLYGSV